MSARTPTDTPGADRIDSNSIPAQRRGASRALLVILTASVAMAGTFAYLAASTRHVVQQQRPSGSQLRVTGIPASVPTQLAYLMGLSTLPTKAAPNFTLTDQNGRTLSLASLRGRAVVLEFMDPNCVDVCPIVSQEFVDAYHDLGRAASRVVFLAVNVNPFHLDVASMAAYSKAHHLDALPSWHFLTGPASSLHRVWRDYNVAVNAPNATADVVHTSVAYFIDPSGQERYVAFPMIDHTATGAAYLPAGPLAQWGVGIATVAKALS